ncbi:MAG TPA: SCO family protein [Candidatus Binatia bacterium]
MKLPIRIAAALVALCVAAGDVAARDEPAGSDAYTYSLGQYRPQFTPPRPGTYELPEIGNVADHPLVDAQGKRTTLRQVLGRRLAVVSFIYASCSDTTGCPMSTSVLHHLDSQLAADRSLARDVALVTVSFDPEHDTARLAAMQQMRAAGSTWRFVTAPDEHSLGGLLEDFGQTVTRLARADGTWSGTYRHVLKVYLLDRERRVRNIYSVGYLDPDLVLADLKTLRLAEKKRSSLR